MFATTQCEVDDEDRRLSLCGVWKSLNERFKSKSYAAPFESGSVCLLNIGVDRSPLCGPYDRTEANVLAASLASIHDVQSFERNSESLLSC